MDNTFKYSSNVLKLYLTFSDNHLKIAGPNNSGGKPSYIYKVTLVEHEELFEGLIDRTKESEETEKKEVLEDSSKIDFGKGSKSDILKKLSELCGKNSDFTGIVKVHIAAPTKASFILYVLKGGIVGIESIEDIKTYRGGNALKRLVDVLSSPSFVGVVELMKTNEVEVTLKLDVDPESRLNRPVKYEEIALFIPMETKITYVEKPVIELVGDDIDIVVPEPTKASVEETHIHGKDETAEIGRRMALTNNALIEDAEKIIELESTNLDKILEALRIMSQSDHPNEPLLARIRSGEETECHILFINGSLIGAWCDTFGLETYGHDALDNLKGSDNLNANIYKINPSKLKDLLKINIEVGTPSSENK